jgi:hypothetical protein
MTHRNKEIAQEIRKLGLHLSQKSVCLDTKTKVNYW